MTEQRAAAPLPPRRLGPPEAPRRFSARISPALSAGTAQSAAPALLPLPGRGEERTRHGSGTAAATLARAQPRRNPAHPLPPAPGRQLTVTAAPAARAPSSGRASPPARPAAGRERRTPRPRYLSRGLLSASFPPVTGRCEDGGSAVQIPGERRRAATGRGRGRPSRGKGLGGRPPGARLLGRPSAADAGCGTAGAGAGGGGSVLSAAAGRSSPERDGQLGPAAPWAAAAGRESARRLKGERLLCGAGRRARTGPLNGLPPGASPRPSERGLSPPPRDSAFCRKARGLPRGSPL